MYDNRALLRHWNYSEELSRKPTKGHSLFTLEIKVKPLKEKGFGTLGGGLKVQEISLLPLWFYLV